MNLQPSQAIRILFDEFHSESWSVSLERAREFQPEDAHNASYQLAADCLVRHDFEVLRNVSSPLTAQLLGSVDVLALVHPCDNHWENTTSKHSPALSPEELHAVWDFVSAGGGLLVISEYEHDKYGDNLNELLAPCGLKIENGKVFDRGHCVCENPEWVLSEAVPDSPLSHLAAKACFYRAGWIKAENAQVAWHASAQAHPPLATLIALAELGQGRVAVVADSNLFGDERFDAFDHSQLWLNLHYWLAIPKFYPPRPKEAPGAMPEHWRRTLEQPQHAAGNLSPNCQKLLQTVNALRALQLPDGSCPHPAAAKPLVLDILNALPLLQNEFPHQASYFAQLPADFAAWIQSGFAKPDFGASLQEFRPESRRIDGIEHLALFPMYTPNACRDIRFEAIVMRTAWPHWLAELERTSYRNPKFVPGHFLAHTEGYHSDCAVFFPETVALRAKASNHFGIIFCDREARRFQNTILRAAHAIHLQLPPDLECLLGSPPLDTLALWDLIHDASHSLGELPFDPFMIRQRAPFWMYGLEELRVDLRTFEHAAQLASSGFPFARHVCSTIVLDRILRFPITGTRNKNYDAFGGQLLFAFLHQHDILIWRDNQLRIQWHALPEGIRALRAELTALYKLAADCSKMAFWIAAHDLGSRYLRPNLASHWRSDHRSITDESDPKKWIDLVHEDEFPLGNFHLNLQRKLQQPA